MARIEDRFLVLQNISMPIQRECSSKAETEMPSCPWRRLPHSHSKPGRPGQMLPLLCDWYVRLRELFRNLQWPRRVLAGGVRIATSAYGHSRYMSVIQNTGNKATVSGVSR